MKKIKTFLITLCVCMLGAIALVACGSTSKPGTYKLYAVRATAAGHTQEMKLSELSDSGLSLTADSITIDLKEDGTCTINLPFSSGTGTWKENAEDSNKIDIEVNSDTLTFVCKGGKIEIPIPGGDSDVTTTYILKK